MAGIILEDFGGMIPKRDPRLLPPNAAQAAHNCNLYGGKLAPIDVTGPFQVLHDPNTGKMKSQIPDGSIISITKPDAPVLLEKVRWWRPVASSFVDVMWTSRLYATYFDPTTGVFTETNISPSGTSGWWESTTDGMIAHVTIGSAELDAVAGVYYTIHGLNFGFQFNPDTQYYGGPDTLYQYPTGLNVTRSSPAWPQIAVPMKFPVDTSGYTDGSGTYTGERFTYATLRLTDVNSPQPLRTVDMTDKDDDTTVEVMDGGAVDFYFKFDFASRNTQQVVNYAIAAVDQTVSAGSLNQGYSGAVTRIDLKDIQYSADEIPSAGVLRLTNAAEKTDDIAYTSFVNNAGVYGFTVSGSLTYAYLEDDDATIIDLTVAGREGPPSEISDKIVVDPTEWVKLTTTRPTGYNRTVLYRGGTSTVYRKLDDELESDTFIDLFVESLGEELPPYGNYPNATLADAKEGSLVVGGHTAIVFDGDEVRPSVPYQFWTFPEEYAFPAGATILGGVAFASSAVIFTATNSYTSEVGKVFRYSGQNAKYASLVELTSARPLLNKRSICVIDQTAFYVCSDGVMAVSPDGVRLVTEELFTREEWLDYKPSLMSCYTNDGSIFIIGLDPNNPMNLRLDIGEGLATFTTYDAFSDADFSWKSKVFAQARKMSWRNLMIHADGYPVEVTLIGDDGDARYTMLIPDDKAKTIPRMRNCRNWEVQLKGRSTIESATIATSVQELNR